MMTRDYAVGLNGSRRILLLALAWMALATPLVHAQTSSPTAPGAPVGALSASISTAQQPQPAKSLQFEVAAIKPGDPKQEGYSSFSPGSPGGQFKLVNTPLKQWVEMGLSVRDSALKAVPRQNPLRAEKRMV